jgi:pantoate--beta-alanine ligase
MADPALPIARTADALVAAVAAARGKGARIGFVPTMGSLHEGHLSLVRLAQQHAGFVVASVFVNPTQFAVGEDFDAYPRREAADAAMLARVGCDLLYAPTTGVMYPEGFATSITVKGPALGLESDFRPTHFAGVATVVAKLLSQVRADVAAFGEKDYQQLQVVRRLVRDLDLGVEIIPGPTLREADGLAMSSRNAYLDASSRVVAGRMNGVLFGLAKEVSAGALWRDAEAKGREALLAARFASVDYVAVRRAATLEPFTDEIIQGEARVLAAARVGAVRLIDNVAAAFST